VGEVSVRTALIGDVHGNLTALEAVLAEIEREGADRIAFGGDAALFGPRPAECVGLLRGMGDRLLAIRGNTDRHIADRTRPDWAAWPEDAATWSRDRLGADRIAWLEALPATLRLLEHEALLVHATPSSDEDVILPDTPEDEAAAMIGAVAEPRVLYGHVHIQYRRTVRAVELVNPGAVGLPFDRDRRAAWAMLDGSEIAFRRTAYDVDGVIAALEREAYPGVETTIRRLREAAP
jgi:predicted phosphodiesterase